MLNAFASLKSSKKASIMYKSRPTCSSNSFPSNGPPHNKPSQFRHTSHDGVPQNNIIRKSASVLYETKWTANSNSV